MPESDIHATLEKKLDEMLQGRTVQDSINPLLGMKGTFVIAVTAGPLIIKMTVGITNIHMDTPTEILHTILLGVVKYFWGQTVFLLEKYHMLHIFQSRLDSVETHGLNGPTLNADYICRYKGGLIGKHFKSLAQVMPFLIYDCVPKTVLDGWTVIGELVILLWHTEITHTERYLASLTRTINDFLNITALCAPSILVSKPKFHFLVHLPAYIRRFGPAIIFSTERYESFNHVFRLSCVHSNRQAPSKDTCKTFACNDAVKHIVTGGYWFHPALKKWMHASKGVRTYLGKHPVQARLLGIDIHDAQSCAGGLLKLSSCIRVYSFSGLGVLLTDPSQAHPARNPVLSLLWTDTHCSSLLATADNFKATYFKAKSFVTANGEGIKLGSHVIFKHPINSKVMRFSIQFSWFLLTLSPSEHGWKSSRNPLRR